MHVVVPVKLKQTPCRSPPQHFGLFECFMSSSGNLLVRRGRPPSQTPRVIRVGKAPKSPLSLRVRSPFTPDVAVRSAVHTVPVPGHSDLDVEPDDGFLPAPEAHHAESSDVSGKVIKKRVSKIIRWGADDIPTESEIMILAERKRSKYHLGMSALHWACENHLEAVVSCIIQRNLVPVDALAEHHKFISFTPIFSGISLMWLRSEGDSDNGLKVPKRGLQRTEEQMCFSIINKLACAGAKLDGEVVLHLSCIRHATLLHIAADYACLFNGRVFQYRVPFLLSVAHLLAKHLKPSEFAALFRKKCKVDGESAVTVCLFLVFSDNTRLLLCLQVKELLESKRLPIQFQSSCIASLLSVYSKCVGEQFQDVPATFVPKDAALVAVPQTQRNITPKSRTEARLEVAALPKSFVESKLIPRSRRRSQSDFSSYPGFIPSDATISQRMAQTGTTSPCSDSDSEYRVLSGQEDIPVTKRSWFPHATRSSVAAKPGTAAGLISSQQCDVFLTSCDQIHVQCKLVRALTPEMLRLFPHFASNNSFWVSHFVANYTGMRSGRRGSSGISIIAMYGRGFLSLVRKSSVFQSRQSSHRHR